MIHGTVTLRFAVQDAWLTIITVRWRQMAFEIFGAFVLGTLVGVALAYLSWDPGKPAA